MSKQSERVKTWRKHTKDRIILAMGGKCVCCGYNKCSSALAFHHLDPNQKEMSLSAMRANPQSWDKIVVELRKCVLICHNCHYEIHEGIRVLPNKYAKFDESYNNYKDLKVSAKSHPCPNCSCSVPDCKKFCSSKCSSRFRSLIDWEKYDLSNMYQTMSVVAISEIIGCSDTAIHKRLKKLNIK